MNPLDQLRDIHLPEPIILWYPVTPGWWLLFVALIGLGAYLIRRARKNRGIKKQVDAIFSLPREQRPLKIIVILKVACVEKFPSETTRLQGEQWVAWLKKHCSKIDDPWHEWLVCGYLKNQDPPKNWHKKLPLWLKQIQAL